MTEEPKPKPAPPRCEKCNDVGWIEEDGEDQYGKPKIERIMCSCSIPEKTKETP